MPLVRDRLPLRCEYAPLVKTSHRRSDRSFDPVASCHPSGLNAMLTTVPPCPSSALTHSNRVSYGSSSRCRISSGSAASKAAPASSSPASAASRFLCICATAFSASRRAARPASASSSSSYARGGRSVHTRILLSAPPLTRCPTPGSGCHASTVAGRSPCASSMTEISRKCRV